MQRLIPFIILTFSLFLLNSCFKANDNVGHDGRCTGSAYCTACSNCSRCGHCSGGGTCGVCSGGSSRRNSSETSPKKSKTRKHKSSESESYRSSKSKSNKPPKVFIDEVNVNINSPRYLAGNSLISIYEKASLKSKILTTVPKNTKLVQLSKQGPWIKVQLPKSKKIGYVYKDVK
ncbi:SH3 domain-containing protein [Chryseobacterium sp. MMS23-Vi53]|uniref:SH3 domain-containing protein n=1 Tax=Chryseobacterium sp. MMS23-Vi53 TaxID=3386644 RepID=UPI0039EAC709